MPGVRFVDASGHSDDVTGRDAALASVDALVALSVFGETGRLHSTRSERLRLVDPRDARRSL